MPENEFKVVVGGDISPLQAALNNAFKSVQDFSIKVGKLPQVAFSTQGIDNYKKSVGQLRAEVGTLTFNNLTKGLDSSAKSLQDFGTAATSVASKSGSSFQSIAASAVTLQSSLQAIPGSINQTGNSFASMSKSTRELFNDLIRLRAELLTATDPATVQRLSAAFAQTAQQIKLLTGTGLPATFQNIAGSSAALSNSLSTVANSFDQIADSTPVISQLSSELTAVGAVSVSTGNALGILGSKLPVNDMVKLRSAVDGLKKDLAIGTNVKIQLNTGQISVAIQTLERDLADLKTQLQSAVSPQAVDKLNKAISLTTQKIKALTTAGDLTFHSIQKGATVTATAVSGMGGALTKIKPGAKAASQSLTDLNRVVQDAPFGFIGIQNNIQPLFESFGRLKTATGSNLKAFQALAGTLAGPAGVLFALSAITSIITGLVQKYGSLSAAINAAFEGTTALSEANREVGRSFAESQGSVAGEIASINSLLSIARDQTLGRKAQGEAIDTLNKKYDQYLPNLTLENVNTKAVTDAVDKLTTALVRQAKARGLEALISKEAQRTAELMTGDLSDQVGIWDALSSTIRNFGGISKSATSLARTGQQNLNKELDKSTVRTNIYTDALKKMLTEDAKAGTLFTDTGDGAKKQDAILAGLKTELDGVNKRIAVTNKLREDGNIAIFQENDALADNLKRLELLGKIDAREVDIKVKPSLEIDPTLTALEVKELDEQYRARTIAAFRVPLIVNPNLQVGLVGFDEKLAEAVRKQTEAKKLGIDIPLSINVNVESNVTQAFDGIKKDIAAVEFEEAFNPLVAKMKESASLAKSQIETGIVAEFSSLRIDQAIVDTLANTGEALGAAIAKGENPLVAAGEAFLHTIGEVVSQFGKEIIALGVAMLAAKNAIKLSFSNPAVAIIAGTALTVLGGLLKSLKFNVPSMAEGGLATGPSSGYLALLHGQELITPVGKVGDMMNDGPVVIAGDWVIRGEDLRFAMATNDKKRRRR